VSGFSLFGKRITASGATTDENSPDPNAMSPSPSPSPAPMLAPAPPVAPPSFDEVYESYFGFVWRSVLNRGIPPWGVDDVVQEVFIVVHRKLAGFEGRSSLRTWLAMVVRRVVADHVRKRGNAPAGEALDGDSVSQLQGPAEALEAKAAARILDALLAEMTEPQREVFILHEIEQMTGREIAEITTTNENTVHTRLRAARRIFQEGLARLRD
jgi:RNA polymerase sigma-70 factor, ECF subfamily